MNLNFVQVIGRITRKPESKNLSNGQLVVNFSVATNRTWKDASGEKKEETEFHNAVCFGKMAETIVKFFDRGDEIYISGRLKTTNWESKDGTKRSRTEVVVERFDFGQKTKRDVAEQVEPQGGFEVPDDRDPIDNIAY